MKNKLRDIRPKPLTEKEKTFMWSKIEPAIVGTKEISTHSSQSNTFSWAMLLLKSRFALAGFLIIALLGSGAATVSASNDAVPGDVLFPLDIAIEKIRLSFSTGNKKKTLQIKFAEERLSEAKIVVKLAGNDHSEDGNNPSEESGSATSSDDSNGGNLNKKQKKVERASAALITALDHLENVKSKLENNNEDIAVLIIDDIISELEDLAKNHIASAQKIKVKINNGSKGLKIAIEATTDSVKTKFEFESKNQNKGKGKGGNKKKTKIEISEESEEEDDDEIDDELDNDGDNDDGDEDDDNKKSHRGKSKNSKSGKKIEICHIPNGNPENMRTLDVSRNSARGHLAHGDLIGECEGEGEGDNATTTPDTVKPIMSNIGFSTEPTTAEISWDTDEDADSKVWFSTTSPLNIENSPFKSSAALATNHTLSLANLEPDTLYYFIASSADGAGNTATSSELSFTTNIEPVVDITAPNISNLGTTAGTTTAEISWNTDEDADSRLWYGTTTPLDESNSEFIEISELVSVHEILLDNLTASTAYYFIVGSADLSSNIATSSEGSFTTLTDTPPEEIDETPPLIEDVTSTNTTSTSTNITWTTSEPATSKVWYSTTTPLETTAAQSTEDATFSTNHSLNILGLTASTTHYYIVASVDEFANTATSSENSFITLP